MFNQADHLTDEDLLLLQDDELSAAKAYRARRHLDLCADCRSRGADLERTISELAHLHHAGFSQETLSRAGSRAQLKAQIDAVVRAASKPRPQRSVFGAALRHPAYSIAALILAALSGFGLYQHGRNAGSMSATAYPESRVVPNANLTPGATREVTLGDICAREEDGRDDQDPVVPPSVQRIIFREYRMADAPAKNYQVDYLISPQLGGTADIRNLWPQPYGTTVWNARAKDALEARLHEMVCEKQIDLQSAQHEIATDWISAYQTVFHTPDPL